MKSHVIAPEVLVLRYEALREKILGANDNFCEPSALDTLLRQGMLVWMREVQNCANGVSSVEVLLPKRLTNSSQQHAKAGSIIADMLTLGAKKNQFEGQYI